ncbi:DUF4365 domain-containing protein [Cryptosporangium phraense]|uniref:DUF4365 domain-containing protein n=1 Tax=Cryptosporangium phraense TaxID=2593070 RepID=UPI00147967ED|nr:DUF4365 domain-containing protein [Cryptosporangium phraense]
MGAAGLDREGTGRLGVSILNTLVVRDLRWVFREQATSDAGIDAHVEARDSAGRQTGRLIALQIKAGPSFFGERTADGWVFRFDEAHFHLWLGHALPVLIVLVDIETQRGYWQQFTPGTVEPTGKGYKIVVPERQCVSDAADEWDHIASGIERDSRTRYEQLLTVLPPSTAAILAELHDSAPGDAAVLAAHLADGRSQPTETCRALLSMAPIWLIRDAARAWRAVASFGVEHGAMAVGSEAFERAAAADPEREGRLLLAAVLPLLDLDRDRAHQLVDRAAGLPGTELVVALIRAILAQPSGNAAPWELPSGLDLDVPAARSDHAVQAILTRHALRSHEWDAAVVRATRALELDRDGSDAMELLAEALLHRSLSTCAHADDLQRAGELMRHAVEQRHRWAGATDGYLDKLLEIHVLSGDLDVVLRYALAAPHGVARIEEAERPDVRRHAAEAAHELGQHDLAVALAEQLGDAPADQLLAARINDTALPRDDQIRLWTAALDEAEATDDFTGILRAVENLSGLGVDAAARLDPLVRRSLISADVPQRITVVAAAVRELDPALPSLRGLSKTNANAALMLIRELRAAHRYDEALDACDAAYHSLHRPIFLAYRVQVLQEADRLGQAEQAAHIALADGHLGHVERARLLRFLALRAIHSGDGAAAERHTGTLLTLTTDPPADVIWLRVAAELVQLRPNRAAALLHDHHPSVLTPTHGHWWLQAFATEPWTDQDASQAYALASQFRDKAPNLARALLMAIIERATAERPELLDVHTHSDPDDDHAAAARRSTTSAAAAAVPDELYAAAFQALDGLIARHGDDLGARKFDGPIETLADEITATVQSTADPRIATDLIRAIRLGRLPLGMLATGLRLPYGLVLIQRAAGVQIAAAADDGQHDLDHQAARDALNRPVVVDASALMVSSQLPGGTDLAGRFSIVHLPAVSRADILQSVIHARSNAASVGSLGWDDERQQLVFHPMTPADRLQLLRRAAALEASSCDLVFDRVVNLPDFGDFDPELFGSWLAPLQLAKTKQWSFWSDDVALRQLARSVGVPAFSTAALTEELTSIAIELDDPTRPGSDDRIRDLTDRQHQLVRAMVADYVVDVPASLDDLLAQAQADEWQPAASAVLLTRPAWWAWADTPFADLRAIYQHVSEHRPEALIGWQYAAMEGLSLAFSDDPNEAVLWMTTIALYGFAPDPPTEDVKAGLSRVAELAAARHLPGPRQFLSAAAYLLHRMGYLTDPATIVTSVLFEA